MRWWRSGSALVIGYRSTERIPCDPSHRLRREGQLKHLAQGHLIAVDLGLREHRSVVGVLGKLQPLALRARRVGIGEADDGSGARSHIGTLHPCSDAEFFVQRFVSAFGDLGRASFLGFGACWEFFAELELLIGDLEEAAAVGRYDTLRCDPT